MADRELFLIDGNSLAYRAFFALPETIATSRGEPTNAIFGFASMLVKILTEYGPKATIVVWDAGMSGREQEYEPYKAERKPRPDLLREQWPHLEPLVEAFGYENVRVEGYEADDVIASLAEQAKEAGIPVMIVTGDRDAYQLATNGSVRIMTTSRGITDTRVYDREGVVERYGIPPELVTDFIGLKGDTSDNIPGVPGIGDKTAAQLLQQYGSLEEVLEHIDEISGEKRRQNLRENADLARISKKPRDAPSRDRRGRRRGRDRGPRARPLAAARGVQPLRAARPAAPAGGGAGRAGGGAARGGRAAHRGARARRRSPGSPAGRGALAGDGATATALRWAAHDGGQEVLTGVATTLAEVLEAWGERPLVAHDWKALRREHRRRRGRGAGDAPVQRHDGRGLPDRPARRRYPLDELLDQAGIEPVVEGGDDAARAAMGGARCPPISRRRSTGLELRPLLEEIELPLVEVLYRLELQGVKLDTYRLGETGGPRLRGDRRAGAPDLRAGRRGVHDRLAAAARRDPVREAGAVAQAPRQDRVLHRRARAARDPRTSTRSSRRSSDGVS